MSGRQEEPNTRRSAASRSAPSSPLSIRVKRGDLHKYSVEKKDDEGVLSEGEGQLVLKEGNKKRRKSDVGPAAEHNSFDIDHANLDDHHSLSSLEPSRKKRKLFETTQKDENIKDEIVAQEQVKSESREPQITPSEAVASTATIEDPETITTVPKEDAKETHKELETPQRAVGPVKSTDLESETTDLRHLQRGSLRRMKHHMLSQQQQQTENSSTNHMGSSNLNGGLTSQTNSKTLYGLFDEFLERLGSSTPQPHVQNDGVDKNYNHAGLNADFALQQQGRVLSEDQLEMLHGQMGLLLQHILTTHGGHQQRFQLLKTAIVDMMHRIRMRMLTNMTQATQTSFEALEDLRIFLLSQILADEEQIQLNLEQLNNQVITLIQPLSVLHAKSGNTTNNNIGNMIPTTPPQPTASNSQLASSPAHHVPSPAHHVPSPAHHITSPTHVAPSPSPQKHPSLQPIPMNVDSSPVVPVQPVFLPTASFDAVSRQNQPALQDVTSGSTTSAVTTSAITNSKSTRGGVHSDPEATVSSPQAINPPQVSLL